jgi:hypothetical protein
MSRPVAAITENAFIARKLETLRNKVLDLTIRNPLVSLNLGSTSAGALRVVDELPDVLARYLLDLKPMTIAALPPLNDDPPDERTLDFQRALRPLVADYKGLNQIRGGAQPGPADPLAPPAVPDWERRIRDKLRERLGMPPRLDKSDPKSLAIWADKCGIDPSFDLPRPQSGHEKPAHIDRLIQTLLLPSDLERRLGNIMVKYRTWQEETGLNVFFAAFGLLEWAGPKTGGGGVLSPILLLPLRLERQKIRSGAKYSVN